ncbi:hypothetical protein PR202_gb11982 [Eleusine coracana subsp. coracana]|uniref:Dirigent protein n=1 Tax=Eleusine coracana subsp. coracana TaxID=191504 RepID=A0AAV5ENT5_ELECO|nr:hypothetical protein QOZ80_7BG0583360 [Eleusine coracana subsp. coracana]GJN24251.1 hypothetical protein PR202_gb11982 [Eleusine coracana subsp. coracana]
MAASRAVVAVLVLLLAAVVTAADDGTTHLHFFMHNVVSGSNPTSVQIIHGPGGSGNGGVSFGDTSVMDNLLTETSSPSSGVGQMQGVYMLSSLTGAVRMVTANILLTSGDNNGSTIAVMGRDDSAAGVTELSVIGGTGNFRLANGYVVWKTAAAAANGPDSTVELHVYLGNGNSTIDASAPVSPADGGGSGSGSGSGSSSGSGSKSSSSGGRVSSGGKWVLAVAAAVVGSWIW